MNEGKLRLMDKLILAAFLSFLAWATWTLHAPGAAPGTLDFSESNYPEVAW